MTTCLGKSCSFCLLCLSFLNVLLKFCMCPSFPFSGMWDLIGFSPDHCFSIYFRRVDPLGLLIVDIGIKHGFSCINVPKVPRELTAPEGRCKC